MSRRNLLSVDLSALQENYRVLLRHLRRQNPALRGAICVVKANAYGQGALPIARALIEAGATRFAVSDLSEALALLPVCRGDRILVLGYTPPEEARLAARCGELDAEIAALSERRGHTVRLAEEASAHGAEVASIRQQIEATRSALFEARRRLLAIQRTRDYLDTAKTALSTRYLSVMEARFRYYCGILFRSDPSFARRATLDAELRAQIEVGGVLRRQDYFSRGVRDLLDLCVRLALVDALNTVSDADAGVQVELPPLILDDPFVNLDTAHLRAARALIEEVSGRFQILYCICHESRA